MGFIDADASAWANDDLIAEIASRPNDMAVMIDQMLVERGGLKKFVELAWATVEADGSYQASWHIDAICDHLQAVSDGEIKRLAIMVPPRHMKSLSTAVMWPAFDWITHPERRFLFSSYAHNLSIRDSTKCRRVLNSPWYKARWGDRFKITSDQNTKVRFENDRGGYRMATSVLGQLTGEGGDFVISDDAHNVSKAESVATRENTLNWWDEAMSTRLNDPRTGAFVLIQQRVHERDLIGHVLSRSGPKAYTVLCLPAEFEPDHPQRWVRDPRREAGELLWPQRIARAEIEELKVKLGPYAAAAQLQQRPAPREGGIFKRSWFRIERDYPLDCDWSRAWDFAATSAKVVKSDPDWTSTAKVGFSRSMGKWYVKEVLRWRVDPNQVRNLVLNMAIADGKGSKQTIPQDPGQAGKDQSLDYVRMLAGYNVTAEAQSGDKMTRAMPFAAQAAGGNVVLLDGDWNDDFLTEITSFPTGAHDDQVDAAASAFNRLTDGMAGLLDYYRRRRDEMEANKQETVAPGGIVSVETSSTDLAKAYFGARTL